MANRRVFFDIETLPDPTSPLFTKDLLVHLGGDPEDPAGWALSPELQKGQEEFVAQSLHPLRSRIACITLAVDSGPVTTPDGGAWDEVEAEMLLGMRDHLLDHGIGRGDLGYLVGHNIRGFDIPHCFLRCVKYGLPFRNWWPWPPMGGKPWEGGADRVHDTKEWLRGSRGFHLRLTETSRWLGLEMAPDDGDGSDVLRWWLLNRRDLITQHCEADVENQRRLYWHLFPHWAPKETA